MCFILRAVLLIIWLQFYCALLKVLPHYVSPTTCFRILYYTVRSNHLWYSIIVIVKWNHLFDHLHLKKINLATTTLIILYGPGWTFWVSDLLGSWWSRRNAVRYTIDKLDQHTMWHGELRKASLNTKAF